MPKVPLSRNIRGAFPRGRRSQLPWRTLGRVMVFLDVANIQQSIKDIRWKKFDYEGLMKFFRSETRLIDVRFYYGILPDHEGQKTFFEELAKMGYTMRVKKIKLIRQPDGTVLRKGNYDVDLAVDAMALVDRYDTAVLFSGDSDFSALAQALKERKKQFIVVSSRRHTATELRTAATHYVDITSLAKHLKRLPPARRRIEGRSSVTRTSQTTRRTSAIKTQNQRNARFAPYFMPARKRTR